MNQQESAQITRNHSDISHPFEDSRQSSAVELQFDPHLPTSGTFEGVRRLHKHEFKSYRLVGSYEQPWRTDKRLLRTKYNNYIVYGFLFFAVLLSGFITYQSTTKVTAHDYCLVFEDNFNTLDQSIWSHEIQIDGFGTGSFDWTTDDPKNSFVDGEGLHIVPTLTNESTPITTDQILNGYTLNITKAGGDGSCTASSNINNACSIRSNTSTGTVIPPVRSARLNTKGKKSIKYGRVEVVAKTASGDWLWPAIWMMPEDSVYGQWPASGEIDIMESRGNSGTYSRGGKDVVTSALHWGPTPKSDSFWRTNAGRAVRRTDYTQGFHTFGIEWSENYLFTYVDSRLHQVLYVDFRGQDMWTKGGFSQRMENQTLLTNPWAKSGSKNAPFDQNFYLVMNVAVGSRNGWFPDGIGQKPWVDAGTSAWDFNKAADKWLPTWGKDNEHGMTIKSVKMWQEGKCA